MLSIKRFGTRSHSSPNNVFYTRSKRKKTVLKKKKGPALMLMAGYGS